MHAASAPGLPPLDSGIQGLEESHPLFLIFRGEGGPCRVTMQNYKFLVPARVLESQSAGARELVFIPVIKGHSYYAIWGSPVLLFGLWSWVGLARVPDLLCAL